MPRFEVQLTKPVTDYVYTIVEVDAGTKDDAERIALERAAANPDSVEWTFSNCGESGAPEVLSEWTRRVPSLFDEEVA